jgi:phosphopantothenoylcysteine decarboxylase/phosphopantothenate--cysteine ligase
MPGRRPPKTPLPPPIAREAPALLPPPAPVPEPRDAAVGGAFRQRGRPGGPLVALAVSGSIAAYKAVEVARQLVKAGARVVPVMTRSARELLGPITLSGITGERAYTDMFDPAVPGEVHVELGYAADVVLLVPATADLLARLASGRADDLVAALALCARGPVLAAPAMHPRMWAHPATQRNVATLEADGRVELVGPVDGEVASGERGVGRMADPALVAAAALARAGKRDLAGLRFVVSAGPTIEDLDPVRFLGNRSTGKMGFAVAERAAARGAEVTLVAGPVELATPFGVRRVDVRGALDMRRALWDALGEGLDGADALVMAAAVADYRPAAIADKKMKRSGEPMRLELVPNPDLLAEIGAARRGRAPVLCGFAVETDTDEAVAREGARKLAAKKVDLVVANHARDSFGKDDNRATIISSDGAEPLGTLPKGALADRILDRVAALARR